MALVRICCFHRTWLTTIFVKETVFAVRVRRLHALVRTPSLIIKHNTRDFSKLDDDLEEKTIMKRKKEFEQIGIRDKSTFLAIVKQFKAGGQQKRSHVEFVTAAVRTMHEYGVECDLECYKKVLDVFPKKKMVPENYFQADMMHFPRHQTCAIELLQNMEDNGVCPDKEMCKLMDSIFGPYTHASRKFARMLYWMPKFKNLTPFPLPKPLPNDVRELAILAIKRISGVDLHMEMQIFDTEELEESLDKTWIISAQSPKQKELLKEHNKEHSLYVEGPFIVWLTKVSISYFILRADAKVFPDLEEEEADPDDVSQLVENLMDPLRKSSVIKKPSIHEQEDGVIMSVCATGTSSRDSALSWIRFLQKDNPILNDLSVLFTLRAPTKELVAVNDKRTLDEDIMEETEPSS